LLVTLGVGLSTIPVSIAYALHGNVQTMIALAEWAQSVLTLQPKPLLVQHVPLIFKIHLFLGLSVFFLFPFTRLIHVWSVPLSYLARPYQIVRTKYVRYR